MYLPDLTPLDWPPFQDSSQLLGVGWLELGNDYSVGPVEISVVAKVAELLVNPWQPALSMGRHPCGFCRFTGGPSTFRLGNQADCPEVAIGASNLWLPGDGLLYVVPSMILHYIDAHGYRPPEEFQSAVLACPPMRSMEYLKAILRNGPEGIAKATRVQP